MKAKELRAQEFFQKMSHGRIIDVRERAETASGIIAGSENIPLSTLDEKDFSKDVPLFFYCSVGQRSLLAAEKFSNAYSLHGGLNSWIEENLPLESEFNQMETKHYSRQMLLPEISLAGQKRIRNSRILLVGGGGLGSPAALYLVGAGVGTLGIIDDDKIDITNLPRQIIYRPDQAGESKATVAKENLERLNPDVEVISYPERLTQDNAFSIISDWDVVLDGADNFPTRYLLNDVSRRLKKPLVSASILGFEGQITTFLEGGPCYACIWPAPPPASFAPSCSEAGILGTVSGLFGIMQANEALKIIVGFGKTLAGSLLLVNLLDNTWHSLRIEKRKDCPVCQGKTTKLPDYELFCANAEVAIGT